jgi:cell division protein FtsW (lipid II flippase)
MSAVEIRTPRRRTGLVLLIIGLLVGFAAYADTGLARRGHVPANLALYVALIGGGFAVAFIVQRRVAPHADPVFLPVAALLSTLGFAIIFRLVRPTPTGSLSAEQATWLLIGLGAFVLTLVLVRDDRQLDGYTYTIGLTGLVLLLLPIVPGIGQTINGARLWVGVGPVSFQPSEFGKILIVIFLASYLESKRELLATGVGRLGLPRVKDLGPLLLAWGTSLAILFMEKDLGASLLYFGVFVVMLWVATGRPAYLVIGILMFAAGAVAGYLLLTHVQVRVDYWLHALEPKHVYGIGYGQIAQGQFALASGGLVGSGLGQGSPTLIPYAATDFIFAAIGEELGMLGTAGVLLLYLVVVDRGLRLALERTDGFGKLLAAGLTTSIAVQTFVIVGGVTRLIPLTGITLPFVSYGGSSLVSNFVLIALLVRVSSGPWERRPRRERPAKPEPEPERASDAPQNVAPEAT